MTSAAIVKSNGGTSMAAVTGTVTLNGIGDVFTLAKALSGAEGFIPKNLLGKPNAIAAAVLTGLELGLGPMEAIRSIHIVEGKPTMSADLMLARAIRAGVRIEWEQCDDKAAVLRLERNSAKHRHSFTIEEATRAKLTSKGVWQSYAPAMLRARCVSAAMRAFCPDVLGSGVYTPEELEPTNERPTTSPVLVTSSKPTLDDIAAPKGEDLSALLERIAAIGSRDELDAMRDALNADPPKVSKAEKMRVRDALNAAQERIDERDAIAMEGQVV
jgi:hypothetical protein